MPLRHFSCAVIENDVSFSFRNDERLVCTTPPLSGIQVDRSISPSCVDYSSRRVIFSPEYIYNDEVELEETEFTVRRQRSNLKQKNRRTEKKFRRLEECFKVQLQEIEKQKVQNNGKLLTLFFYSRIHESIRDFVKIDWIADINKPAATISSQKDEISRFLFEWKANYSNYHQPSNILHQQSNKTAHRMNEDNDSDAENELLPLNRQTSMIDQSHVSKRLCLLRQQVDNYLNTCKDTLLGSLLLNRTTSSTATTLATAQLENSMILSM